MIDKCRATLAGTAGEYVYPCPLDKRLLEWTGITADQFSDAVRHGDDAAVAEWFVKAARPHSSAEIAAWNEAMLTAEPDTDEKRAYFRSQRDAIDPTRNDISAWADLLDLEEKRPVPIRKSRSA
jgi:hypothetical protein